MIKLLHAGKNVMKKKCGFCEVFNIFDEIDNNCNKLDGYNPRTLNKINTKS